MDIIDIEFEDFRDLLDFIYEEANEVNAVRIDPPTDTEKLKLFYALEAYVMLLMEQSHTLLDEDHFDTNNDRDIWDDMIIP